ncbi:hypothetical protein PVAND_006610 [Polypedilum vanderplanki]|uniref:Uncharacterized protein n=1 Tax=Polypedilum vanderplanki TaxID=319348 RepID=A0A9J6C476_POLVA|nr:hypothetical protein PVAND_006610 [Polypedilum vanderplanki]
MAKIISQDTYDEVLKENIIEFSMTIDEARAETIKQFEAQGINLANIIQDLNINENSGVPVINESIDALKMHVEGNKILNVNELNNQLDILASELSKTVPHRVHASKRNAQEYLLKIIESEINNGHQDSILHKAILCAHAMTTKNPDIFDSSSLSTIVKLLDTQSNERIICDILKWIQKACLLHEMNRQMIMNEEILVKHLKPLLFKDDTSIIKNVCMCFRYLIADDDIRVEFGKAHEHARLIANECLIDLTQLLVKFKDDSNTLADIMLTMAALAVRNEFCQLIADNNGVTLIMDAMVSFPDSIKIQRESFKIFKALGGNDSVKATIIKAGAAPVLESSLNRHKADEILAKNALACISTLSLRSKENAIALFEAGLPETIVDTLKIHEKNKLIQRNGAWAIRNMVSRSKEEQNQTWMDFGVEEILEKARKNHPSIDQDCRSALRDLGAKVHLNEEWKGVAEKQISNE